MDMKPLVALVGRPNVGKSTLLNRLAKKRIALVHDRPGVTRDRRSVDVDFFGFDYEFMDTPGLYDPGTDEVPSSIAEGMRFQALRAIEDADLICFMIDGRQGCTPYDYTLAKELRRLDKPIIVLVNKSEGYNGLLGLSDASTLGLSDVIVPISAEHGEGMSDLAQALETALNLSLPEEDLDDEFEENEEEDKEHVRPSKPIQLVIMGRPNAGKSTLFNTLIGEERQLTGDLPGLTRDAISVPFHYDNVDYLLFDTAGIRRQARVIDSVEHLAVQDAKKALQFGEVVVFLIDGEIPMENHLEKQDLTLAQLILEEGRALVFAINKWDLVQDKQAFLAHFKNELTYKLAQGTTVPIVTISATQNKNCASLMQAVCDMNEQWNRRISTSKLNQWFDFVVEEHSPPIVRGQRIKLKYITQIKSRPPSFVVFGTKSKDIPESYKKYLINRIRQDFKLSGVPIRLHFKSPKNPYN